MQTESPRAIGVIAARHYLAAKEDRLRRHRNAVLAIFGTAVVTVAITLMSDPGVRQVVGL